MCRFEPLKYTTIVLVLKDNAHILVTYRNLGQQHNTELLLIFLHLILNARIFPCENLISKTFQRYMCQLRYRFVKDK